MYTMEEGKYQCIVQCVSGQIVVSGLVTVSSGIFSGFDDERDRTFRYLAYSSGQNVISQSEGNRGESGIADMGTEEGRRNIALPLEELNYYGVIKMVKTLGSCDTGIVMFHPFGNSGKIDVLWFSNLFGINAFEDKLHTERTKPDKCRKEWMNSRVIFRYPFVEEKYKICIKNRICVVTIPTWYNDMSELLVSNKIHTLVVGKIDDLKQEALALDKFYSDLKQILEV
jgi:hypothetical protein